MNLGELILIASRWAANKYWYSIDSKTHRNVRSDLFLGKQKVLATCKRLGISFKEQIDDLQDIEDMLIIKCNRAYIKQPIWNTVLHIVNLLYKRKAL